MCEYPFFQAVIKEGRTVMRPIFYEELCCDGGCGDFFLACKEFLRMFDCSFPACVLLLLFFSNGDFAVILT